MKIVLVPGHAADHPDIPALTALIVAAGIAVEKVDRPAGAIAFVPCIAALDDIGVSRACFGTDATAQSIKTSATADGTVVSPVPVPQWDALQFKRRFTQAEREAILTAAKTNVMVQDFIGLLDTAAACGTMIHADDPDVIAGLNAYEGAGFIATGRAAIILGEGASP